MAPEPVKIEYFDGSVYVVPYPTQVEIEATRQLVADMLQPLLPSIEHALTTNKAADTPSEPSEPSSDQPS